MRTNMPRTISVLMILVVIYHGSGAMKSSDSSASTEHTLHIGKSFAHCDKLTKDNYMIWMTGIITWVVGCGDGVCIEREQPSTTPSNQ